MKITIIGGGLWGGMLAWMLSKKCPDAEFVLYEESENLGGNHTWSFHKGDLSEKDFELIRPLITYSWPSYKVRFPAYSRDVYLPYCTITSEHFNKVLKQHIPQIITNTKMTEMPEGIVFDLRGSKYDGECGYQKFTGLEITTKEPHGMDNPVIMDATVSQIDGFRFIYYLPFSHERILIEDTRYSNTASLDSSELIREILQVIHQNGWSVKEIIREEAGILPIPFSMTEQTFSGRIFKPQNVFHDTTGFSLPDAVRMSSLITSTDLTETEISKALNSYIHERQKHRRFFILLNKLMFQAASQQDRYKPLEFFYRSSTEQISKFYRGELNLLDRFRFFAGKPPVRLNRALGVLIKDGLP